MQAADGEIPLATLIDTIGKAVLWEKASYGITSMEASFGAAFW